MGTPVPDELEVVNVLSPYAFASGLNYNVNKKYTKLITIIHKREKGVGV